MSKKLNIKSLGLTDIKIENFLISVQKECSKNDVALVIEKRGEVSANGIQCNGYFSEETRELSFWVDSKDMSWLLIAIHELSHMRQYLYKPDFWDSVVGGRYNSAYLVDPWLNGANYSKVRVKAFIDNAIKLEYDCEKLTVDLIDEFELQHVVPPKEYIKKANAYVLFYHIVKKQRKFYEPTKEPYFVPEVWGEMPDTFFGDPTNEEECVEAISVLKKYYSK